MNNTIIELLNEATSGHVEERDSSRVRTVSLDEMEKFAELIIAECVAAIMTKDRYRREYFARVVQRRFGMLDDGDDDE